MISRLLVLAAPALVLTSQFSVGPLQLISALVSAPIRIFSVLTKVSGREERADISLISPKITGVVPVSGANTTHPVAFMAGVGRQGRGRLCCVGGN